MSTLIDNVVEEAPAARENASRVVWALAWPAVALNSLQVVNTLLDRGFIGHLPTSAITAHGGATSVMFLMFSLAVSIAAGATALVSRAFGAGEAREYREASRQSFNLAIAAGFLLGGVTVLAAHWAAAAILPSSDHAAIDLMTRFCVVYALGLPAVFVIQTLAGSLRGVGDTKSPMYISGLQIFLHMTLNFLLVFPARKIGGVTLPGAGMGLVGAAVALTASTWVSAIVYVLFAGRTPLGPQPLRLPKAEYVRRILRIAVPAATMATLRVFSLTVFTLALALAPNGSAAIAAMSTGFGIEQIITMPFFGLSAAAGALVGQSLGMRRPDRAERLAWTASHYGGLVTVILAGLIFVAAPPIASVLLDGKAEIVRPATDLMHFLCPTEVLFAYAMVLIGAMQGAGDTVRPMWISLVALWGLRVPLAFLLTLKTGQPLAAGVVMPLGFGLGATGAWISMSLTQGLQGLMAMAAFKQGAWKTKRV